MDEKEMILAVIVGPDGKTVKGLGGNAPLELLFLAILTKAKPVAIHLVPAEEFKDGQAPLPKRTKAGKMDPTLRARSECPVRVEPGAVADMLSILSDKIAGGR